VSEVPRSDTRVPIDELGAKRGSHGGARSWRVLAPAAAHSGPGAARGGV